MGDELRREEPQAGDVVQIVGEAGAWRGAIGTIEKVLPGDGRPNLEPVALVVVEDLGATHFAVRHLRVLQQDQTTQAGAGASSDAAPTEREAATRSGDAAPAPGKGAFISADEMTERLRERARRLMTNAARVHDRIGDNGIVLGWRGLHIDLDEMAADIEAIRTELRR